MIPKDLGNSWNFDQIDDLAARKASRKTASMDGCGKSLEPMTKRRGRPAGSKNKKTEAQQSSSKRQFVERLARRNTASSELAYAMLGPAFQASLDRQKFGSAAGALQVNARATNYAPAGPCTLRERGAYTCDYTVSYSNGRTRNERLVMAGRNGAWVIAGDRSGPFE
jgi:hypothetical protein